MQFSYGFGVSQPARFLHDFLYLGFNSDEANRQVFDGVLSWIGGASGGFFNYRFAQPGRTHRQHIGRKYPERVFPFADQTLFDPITGQTDGRLQRCSLTGTCPKIFEVNSANECGDPRLSLQERYPSNQAYVDRVSTAARNLLQQRLLLQEDVDRVIAAARASGVGN